MLFTVPLKKLPSVLVLLHVQMKFVLSQEYGIKDFKMLLLTTQENNYIFEERALRG